jgi:hypothetical protein
MTHQATITFTPAIIHQAVRHYWWRTTGRHGLLWMTLTFSGTAVLLVKGDRSWLVGGLGTVSALLALSTTCLYVVSLRRALWKFNRMLSKSIHFTFTESEISSTSDLGSSKFSWRAIMEVWRFPDVWLLFVAKNIYFILPLAELDLSIQAFIADRVAHHGGRVA